jgi:hypothetical protein
MKPSLKYGLMLGGILAAVPLIFFALGIEKEEIMQTISGFLNVGIAAVIVFLGIRETREIQGNGFISFGTGFSTGMMISMIGGAISAAFTYLYFTIINPGMVTYIKLKQEEKMMEGGMSDADLEKFSGTMDFWTNPGIMSAFSFLVMIFLGLVLSLICAGILKKEDPTAQFS